MNYDDLKQEILSLKEMLSRHSIQEIYQCTFLEINNIDWNNLEKMNLCAPFQQSSYIASLALSVAQIDETLPVDKEVWEKICRKTNNIYSYYGLMHFPESGDFSTITKEKHKQGCVTIPSLLLELSTGVLATVEQIKEDILSLYTRFSSEIESKIGLNVEQMMDICAFIGDKLQSRLENLKSGFIEAKKCWQAFRKDLDNGIADEIAFANAEKCMRSNVKLDIDNIGIISFNEIAAKFSIEQTSIFMKIFSQARTKTSNSEEIIFPNNKLSISLKPLFQVNENDFALVTANHLILAVQRKLYSLISELNLLGKFNSHKGVFLEEKSLSCFKAIFGKAAHYYREIYETPGDQNEHDILIIYKKTLLIIECKAKKIRKYMRDIESSFSKISADFKDYIQEGYMQARGLEKLILNEEETSLYKKGGGVEAIIKRKDIHHIEKIIVTYENEGLLASKLSLLLDLDKDDDFPLCINIQSLRQIADYKNRILLTPEKFLDYLKKRRLAQDKIVSDDELNILGYFLKRGDFNKAPYYISNEFSKIFDDAYIEEKFPDSPKSQNKIGRNEPCHCGSDKKYKKCCLKFSSI